MVLMWDGAAGMALITSIADIGGTVKPLAAFFHKVFTMLVTRRTGSTLDMAEDDLPADIFLLAVKAVDTEVFGIQEEPPAGIEVRQTVGADFFGNGTGIFTEVAGDLLEGSTDIQLAFNVKPVCSGKVFMVSWNKFTHDVSFHCCQGQRHHNVYAGLNSTCVKVTSIEETTSRIYFCNLGYCVIFQKWVVNLQGRLL